ncbi:MAG: hypothetical protein J6A25_01150 [Lachnospiraceae bacterium]|nr:hypothetical protein [Lachnospiraceae bacterium]
MGYPTKITDFSDIVSIYDSIEFPSRKAFGQTYPDNHVFDENQSVKWNREEVQRRNAEAMEKYKNARDEYNRQLQEFWIDMDKYLANEFKLSLEAAHEFRLAAWQCNTVECEICSFQTFLEDFYTCYMQIWEDKK